MKLWNVVVRMLAAFGIEQDARGLAAAGREDHHSAINRYFRACLLIDIRDTAGQPVATHHHFARHGVGADFQVAGLHGRKNVDARGVKIGVYAAAAAALRAIMASRPAIERARENRQAGRDAGNFQLAAYALNQLLAGARRGRGWNFPSGVFSRPSRVPKTPISSSALS